VGLPGISHDSPDLPALAALNYLLGETGYAGRLGETLVDTGIAYAVYASVLADRQPGPIFITTDAVRSTEAVDRILDTLGGFAKDGVSDAELTEAKGYLLGRLLFRFESPQAAARTLCELGTFGAPDALQTFARQVLALRTAEVDVVARRYYDPARAVVVVAGR
jgi:zinc protease